MNLFLIQVNEAKNLFNEYSQIKNLYSNSPTPDNEIRLKDSLALFLRKVIGVCGEIEAKTESGIERDLLRLFADELKYIFK